jgi:hypothetical protein
MCSIHGGPLSLAACQGFPSACFSCGVFIFIQFPYLSLCFSL